MKKLFALLLALVMLLGCAAFAEAVDYVGTWVLTRLETPEMTMDMALLNQLGIGMTMTLNGDGTMFTDTMGVKEEGTWVVTATGIAMTDDEETLQVTYVDDMLRIEKDGAAMLLAREGAIPQEVPAEPTNVADVDFVSGYWVLTEVEAMGFKMDAEALQMQGYMELYEDGTCWLVANDEAIDGTWAKTETGITTTDANGETDVYTYVNDTLVVEQEGVKLIFNLEEYTVPLVGLTVADFDGEWVFHSVDVGNAFYDADELGLSMRLSIQDGKGVHTETYMEESGEVTNTYNGVCEVEEVPDFGTVMYFLYTDEAGNPTDNGLALLRFNNGELVWYVVDEADNVMYYCFLPEAMLEE